MSTKDKVYGMVVSDSCSYRMIPFKVDLDNAQLSDISIPFVVKSGIKTILNQDNKLENFPYSEPENFQLRFPEFKISFCDDNKPDSAFFTTFFGDKDAANMYLGNLNNDNKDYKTDFLGFANLVLQNTDVDKNENEIGDIGTDMMNTISGFQNE